MGLGGGENTNLDKRDRQYAIILDCSAKSTIQAPYPVNDYSECCFYFANTEVCKFNVPSDSRFGTELFANNLNSRHTYFKYFHIDYCASLALGISSS